MSESPPSSEAPAAPPPDPITADLPGECQLAHKLFGTFGPVLFRRSEVDGAPVMVVQLGEREAALPLTSLQREFGIAEQTSDGRMLALIAEALDFVSVLRPGDKLPSEVLTGEASWSPDKLHLELAHTRLRIALVEWLNEGAADHERLEASALLAMASDPALRAQVHTALTRAAEALGLESSTEVVGLLETLGNELAYIEALRDRLLRRVRQMSAKIERLARGWRSDASHIETLTQVKRLTALALRQISARFDELDAQTGEVMAALRNVDSQRAFIRTNRDWLYRSQRAWEPILAQWDAAAVGFDEGTLALLGRTYHFLAPRFMPVTEWISATRPGQAPKRNPAPRMIW